MINILIVEDSETEVQLIKTIINSEPDLTVVGVARNGKEAIELTSIMKPDLITMDIQMPIMDGLEATRQIMSHYPTPIVVISSTVGDESLAATYPILEAGALSALAKPRDIFSPGFESTRRHIVNTLRSMAEIKVARKRLKISPETLLKNTTEMQKRHHVPYDIIGMGVSVGGPLALKTIFSALPEDFPVPIVAVQHMSIGFLSGYVKWLNGFTHLEVREAQHMEALEKGTVYIAPDNYHLEVCRVMGKLHSRLVKGDPVDGFFPSITVLLDSVAEVCNRRAIGMLLTGMGSDGATGLLNIKENHGHTIIQDQESAVVFGMAGVAQSMGAVDNVIPLEKIADYLIEITR